MCADSFPVGGIPRGLTLIELLVFIVVISVGLVGILSVMNQAVRGSADPLQREQALALAEAILEEVLSKDVAATLPETNFATCSHRANYVGIRDYACFDGAPGTAVIAGNATLGATASPLLAKLTATVAVADVTVSRRSLVRVTVTVTGAVGGGVAMTGYRVAGL